MAIVYHRTLLIHSKKKQKTEEERESILELVFKPHPKEQLLFILLGCAGEEHQIVLFSGICVRWHVVAVRSLFS